MGGRKLLFVHHLPWAKHYSGFSRDAPKRRLESSQPAQGRLWPEGRTPTTWDNQGHLSVQPPLSPGEVKRPRNGTMLRKQLGNVCWMERPVGTARTLGTRSQEDVPPRPPMTCMWGMVVIGTGVTEVPGRTGRRLGRLDTRPITCLSLCGWCSGSAGAWSRALDPQVRVTSTPTREPSPQTRSSVTTRSDSGSRPCDFRQTTQPPWASVSSSVNGTPASHRTKK